MKPRAFTIARDLLRHTWSAGGGDAKNVLHCDYAIVGYGRAGRSAARRMRRLDPNADVVVVDPRSRTNWTTGGGKKGDASAGTKRTGGTNGSRISLRVGARRIDRYGKSISLTSSTRAMRYRNDYDGCDTDDGDEDPIYYDAVRYRR